MIWWNDKNDKNEIKKQNEEERKKRSFETLISKKGLNFKGFHQKMQKRRKKENVEHSTTLEEGFTYVRVRDIKSRRRAR